MSSVVVALGWLTARLGCVNPVADLVDQLGTLSSPIVIGLWIAAIAVTNRKRCEHDDPERYC